MQEEPKNPKIPLQIQQQFQQRGSRCFVAASNDARVIHAMVSLAQSRQWERLTVSGHPRAWLSSHSAGFGPRGRSC